MEQIDVLGYYAKKFAILNNVVILAIMNKSVNGKQLCFDKTIKGDRKKFLKYLCETKLFNDKEIDEILKHF